MNDFRMKLDLFIFCNTICRPASDDRACEEGKGRGERQKGNVCRGKCWCNSKHHHLTSKKMLTESGWPIDKRQNEWASFLWGKLVMICDQLLLIMLWWWWLAKKVQTSSASVGIVGATRQWSNQRCKWTDNLFLSISQALTNALKRKQQLKETKNKNHRTLKLRLAFHFKAHNKVAGCHVRAKKVRKINTAFILHETFRKTSCSAVYQH